MKIISYGGGVQSTALLVLAAQGRIDATHAVFANTGDDSEHPDTLRYVRTVAAPYAARHGIELVELCRHIRGERVTLLQDVVGPGRSIRIPVYMANGAPGTRACTTEWKIHVIERWLRQQGVRFHDPATVHVGISADEVRRLSGRRPSRLQTPSYPLVDMGLTRKDCVALIAAAGLPVPPKSACWFCPFKRRAGWQEMRRREPELFAQAVALEERINRKRALLGKDAVHLSAWLRPLADIPEPAPSLFDEVADQPCDSGYCMT